MDFLKKIFNSNDPKNKKIQNLTFALLIGIGILLYGVTLFSDDIKKIKNIPNRVAETDQEVEAAPTIGLKKKASNDFESQLEERLEAILSKVDHAGEVQVMVTLETSKEIVVAKDENNNSNITKEKDIEGGTRDIQVSDIQSKIILKNEAGDTQPVVLKEVSPKVLGVLILADGGDQPKVQAAITNAVTTLLGLPTNKVQVIKKGK